MSVIITKVPPARGGPERYWQIIRTNADTFTVRMILDGIQPKVSRRAIRRYLEGLIRQGIVEVAGHRTTPQKGGWDETLYRCLKPFLPTPVSHDVEGSRHGQLLQHLWNSMRSLREFMVDELVALASIDGHTVSRTYVSAFVHALETHEMVRLVQAKRGTAKGSTPAIYTLAKAANAGPKPPKVNKEGRGIFDPNRRVRITLVSEVPA